MSQSLSKLYIHAIFHIKNANCFIRPENENELYSYIGSTFQLSKSIPIIINGTKNHVHVLFIMSKNVSLSDLMEDIKKNSSRWIKSRGNHYLYFEWQRGYSGYSVSQSKVEAVKKYILNQKEHHKKFSFEEEYILFLNEYGIDYEEKYLWTLYIALSGRGSRSDFIPGAVPQASIYWAFSPQKTSFLQLSIHYKIRLFLFKFIKNIYKE